MLITKNFKQLDKEDVQIAGGKGASLGEMTTAGISVPGGFVILSGVFDEFLKETDLNVEIDAELNKVNTKKLHTVESASEKIQGLIMNAEISSDIAKEIKKGFKKLDSKFVAVRSSATSEDGASAAWAGQLDSFLNTTENELLNNIKRCWASLFTSRAIFYRFEQKLNKDYISVAVVVQKMVDSEKSGVAFSVHPVTEDYNQLIIEAGFGLGEAIVSGSITPDSYVVDKKEKKIIDININNQTRALYKKSKGGNEWKNLEEKGEGQVLSKKEIIELSRLIIKIENHYGFPCDIEWAQEKGKLYIVQSRPITTLSSKSYEKNKTKKTLTNVFSREKDLIYFSMRDDSDRKGMMMFGEKIKNNLFIIPPLGQKGSVWYEQKELEELKNKVVFKLKKYENNAEWDLIRKLSKKSWKFIKPYVVGEKTIKDDKNFEEYYNSLVNFWVCLNSITYEAFDDKNIAKEIRDYLINFRNETEQFTEKMSFFLVDYLSSRLKNKNILHFITAKETLHFLKGKLDNKDFQSIKKREKGCFMLNGSVYPFGEIKKVLNKNDLCLEKIRSSGSVLSGEAVFGGVRKGRIIKIENFNDLEKVKKGDVLVSQMTNPEYLSAVKRAVAIITDQGGSLCHAAIVARELKKPCIVGTKVATKVLNDGDLVEVDADKGVVRVLKKNEEFNPNDWESEFRQRNKHTLLMADQWCKALNKNLTREANLNVPKYDYMFTSENKGYLKPEIKKRFMEIFTQALRKQAYINYIFKTTIKRIDELDDCANDILEAINSNEFNIAKEWKKFNRLFLKVIPWFWIPYYISEFNIFTDRVKKGILKYKKEINNITDINNALSIMTFPAKETLLQKERMDFYEIVLAEKEGQFNLDLKRKYLENFSWIKTFIMLPIKPLTMKELNEKIKSALKDDFLEEFRLQQKMKEKNKKIFSKIFGIVSKDKKLKQDILNSQELGWLLSFSVEKSLYSLAKLIPFYKKIAKKLSVPYSDWNNFTVDEVQEMLNSQKGKSVDIEKRKKAYAYIMEKGEGRFFFGSKAQEIINSLKKFEAVKINKDVQEIIGQSTMPGKVIGKIRICLGAQDSRKLQKDEVLVCSMTSPEYVSAMKRAVAIITDEGGLLCHAAIISRELGKPCIVGTKIATQVFKDGDLVEVDADEGVVQVLKRAGGGNSKVINQDNLLVRQDNSKNEEIEKIRSKLNSAKTWGLEDLKEWKKDSQGVIMERQAFFFHFAHYLEALDYTSNKYNLGVSAMICSDGKAVQIMGAMGKKGYWFGSTKDQYFLGKRIIEKWKKHPKTFIELGLIEKHLNKEIDDYFEKFFDQEEKMEIDVLRSNFDKARSLMTRLLSVSLLCMTADTYLNAELSKIVKNEEEKRLIAKGLDFSFIYQEEEELLKIASLNNKKIIKRRIKEHTQKYFFINNSFGYVEDANEGLFLKRMEDFRQEYKNRIFEEIEKRTKERAKEAERYYKLLKKYKDKGLDDILKYVNKIVYTRDFTKKYQMKLFSALTPLLLSISQKIKLSGGLIFFSFPHEVFDIIENPQKWQAVLKKRKIGVVAYWVEGRKRATVIEAHFAEKILKEINKEKLVRQFKGQVATKGGRVIGKVKVVMNPSEVKFGKGSILVTDMTTPDFVPIMKKSRAIITNIGGITCHAAIVSRELGIPCIIGTKIATKVLKDGDLVKVDTDKGVVRILKRGVFDRKRDVVDAILQKEDWFNIVSFKTELLTEYIIHQGYRKSLPKLLPQIPKFRNRMIIDNDVYIDLLETNKIQEYFYLDTIRKATEVYDLIEKQSIKLTAISKEVVKNLYENSNTELIKKLDKFFEVYQDTIGMIGVPTIIDMVIESKIKDILEKNNFKNIKKALATLAIPYRSTETFRENVDLLKIVEKVKKNKFKLDDSEKELRSLVRKHQSKYGWIYATLFLGKVYSESQIKGEIKKYSNSAKEEIKKMKKKRRDEISQTRMIIDKIESEEERKLIRFFQRAMYYRTARLEWMNKACFIVRPLLEESSKRLKIKFDGIIYLLPSEINNCLMKGRIAKNTHELIKERQEGYAIISDNKNEYFLTVGEELDVLKKKFYINHNNNFIKGSIAHKGDVKGIVVIVKDRSELSKVQKGNILVARLTTPDFIVAMKKSRGIITDLGGITSHAALTSRELEIPCIVGAKNATQILKDGDLVEVDADEGVVRILKKNK